MAAMKDTSSSSNNDDKVIELIKNVYKPVAASPEFKEQLLNRLKHELRAITATHPEKSLLKRKSLVKINGGGGLI